MKNIWIDTIIDLWTGDTIKLSPPSTIEKIKATEETLIFEFPSDFKEFYLRLDGFVDWDWTKNMFSIWPLHRIIEDYNHATDKTFIAFADYLINAHHIGFIKGKTGIFKNYGTTPELIANSFSEVISLINSDADILY